MKNILFIVNNLTVGGIEKVCWEIVNHIDPERYTIDFLVAVDENVDQYYMDKVKKCGCKVFKGGYIYTKSDKKRFLMYERDLLKQKHYDIVHSHVDFLNIWTLKTAKKCGIQQRISHVHTTMPNRETMSMKARVKYHLQKLLIYRYSTDRLGCSRQACIDFYGETGYNVFFNGFDIDTFLMKHDVHDPYHLITVGRIVEQKNPVFICEVMKELTKMDNRYHLTWIGDGNLKNTVVDKINEFHLNTAIDMLGVITDTSPYLSQCGYALYPSVCEGLGISLIEAQLAYCFVFYSDVVPQEADIGYSMSLPLKEDAKFWAQKIDSFIKENKKLKYTLNMKAAAKYDINTSIKLLEKIYDSE